MIFMQIAKMEKIMALVSIFTLILVSSSSANSGYDDNSADYPRPVMIPNEPATITDSTKNFTDANNLKNSETFCRCEILVRMLRFFMQILEEINYND